MKLKEMFYEKSLDMLFNGMTAPREANTDAKCLSDPCMLQGRLDDVKGLFMDIYEAEGVPFGTALAHPIEEEPYKIFAGYFRAVNLVGLLYRIGEKDPAYFNKVHGEMLSKRGDAEIDEQLLDQKMRQLDPRMRLEHILTVPEYDPAKPPMLHIQANSETGEFIFGIGN